MDTAKKFQILNTANDASLVKPQGMTFSGQEIQHRLQRTRHHFSMPEYTSTTDGIKADLTQRTAERMITRFEWFRRKQERKPHQIYNTSNADLIMANQVSLDEPKSAPSPEAVSARMATFQEMLQLLGHSRLGIESALPPVVPRSPQRSAGQPRMATFQEMMERFTGNVSPGTSLRIQRALSTVQPSSDIIPSPEPAKTSPASEIRPKPRLIRRARTALIQEFTSDDSRLKPPSRPPTQHEILLEVGETITSDETQVDNPPDQEEVTPPDRASLIQEQRVIQSGPDRTTQGGLPDPVDLSDRDNEPLTSVQMEPRPLQPEPSLPPTSLAHPTSEAKPVPRSELDPQAVYDETETLPLESDSSAFPIQQAALDQSAIKPEPDQYILRRVSTNMDFSILSSKKPRLVTPSLPPMTIAQLTQRLAGQGWHFKRKPLSITRTVDTAAIQTATALEHLPKAGSSLPAGPRTIIERALARDFGEVRLHTTPLAPLSLRAATRGRDVHVEPGLNRFETPEAISLLGHELTHVAQQGLARPLGPTAISPIVQQLHDLDNQEVEAEYAERFIFNDISMVAPSARPVERLQVTMPVQQLSLPDKEAFPLLPAVQPPLEDTSRVEALSDLPPELDQPIVGQPPDLKRLAEKIYPLIKRRLAIEQQQMPH